MKKHFMTGLAILLPMVITIIIVRFLLNFFTKPFIGTIEGILHHYDLLGKPFWIFSSSDVVLFSSKLIVLILLIGIIIGVGVIGRLVLINLFFHFSDWVMHRIPLVNKIYKAIQDALHTLFTSKEKSTFSQVVLVPFPHQDSYSIGLITNQSHVDSDPQHRDFISVFVPGTPNPTMGFMLLFKHEQLIYIDMKVEDAFKFLISCGVMLTEFTISHKQ